MPQSTIGQLIKQKQHELGWSDQQMAEALGSSGEYVAILERSAAAIPSHTLLQKLADLGIPSRDLLLALGAISSEHHQRLRGVELGLPAHQPHHLTFGHWLNEARHTIEGLLHRQHDG